MRIQGGRWEPGTSGDVDVGFVPRHCPASSGLENEGTNLVRLVVEKQPGVDPGHERVTLTFILKV